MPGWQIILIAVSAVLVAAAVTIVLALAAGQPTGRPVASGLTRSPGWIGGSAPHWENQIMTSGPSRQEKTMMMSREAQPLADDFGTSTPNANRHRPFTFEG